MLTDLFPWVGEADKPPLSGPHILRLEALVMLAGSQLELVGEENRTLAPIRADGMIPSQLSLGPSKLQKQTKKLIIPCLKLE